VEHKIIVKGNSAECSCGGWWYELVNSKGTTKEWMEQSRQKSFQRHINESIRQGDR
jgi:hypothetical protein